MTTDPRLVKAAIPVTHVTYEEAAELAYFGAEVLHPIAMQPAIRSQIPVRVKNSYNPSAVGTAITMGRDKSSTLVTAITSKNSVQLVDIVSTRMLGQYGFLAEVFRCFQECEISVDVIASSEVSLSLTLDKKQVVKDTHRLLSKLNQFAETTVFEDRAIVTLISNLDRSSEVMAIAFQVMVGASFSPFLVWLACLYTVTLAPALAQAVSVSSPPLSWVWPSKCAFTQYY